MQLILLIIIIISVIIIFRGIAHVKFTNVNSNQLIFTRLNGTLIKSYNINLSYILNNDELMNLFTNNTIKINIPINYSAIIKYNYINNPTINSKIIQLPSGIHYIYKSINNNIINEIDIKNTIVDDNDINIPLY